MYNFQEKGYGKIIRRKDTKDDYFLKSENQPNISSDLHFSADNTDGKQKELTNII